MGWEIVSNSLEKKKPAESGLYLDGGEGGMTQNSLWAVLPLRASRRWRSVPNASRFVEPDGSHPVLAAQMKTPPLRGRLHLNGGEGGIRTLDTLLTYTPLAGERLQPLGHFS